MENCSSYFPNSIFAKTNMSDRAVDWNVPSSLFRRRI